MTHWYDKYDEAPAISAVVGLCTSPCESGQGLRKLKMALQFANVLTLGLRTQVLGTRNLKRAPLAPFSLRRGDFFVEGSLTREGDSLVLSNIASSLLVRETFLPKIDSDGSTLAHLQHLHSTGIRAMLLAPETGMTSYAGTALFSTFGVPCASTSTSTSTLSRPPSSSPSANSPRTSSTLSTPSGSASEASLRSPSSSRTRPS
ncbi:hypothetical protein K438DRAFT_1977239 [Mycena galopus ATCC 62051]|nr:hypothetical protein K438DRAFT_1977239 [Mycena galopus ATCC 62051]